MPLTVTSGGSTVDTTGSLTVTVPSVTAVVGDLIVLTVLTDGFTDQSASYLPFNITWGSLTGVGADWNVRTVFTKQAPDTTVGITSLALLIATGGTHDVVVEWSPMEPTPSRQIVQVAIVSGLTGSDFFFSGAASSGGSGTVVTGPSLLMRRNESVIIAGVQTDGPVTDTAGVWTGGFTSLERVGTNVANPNITLDVGYLINTIPATYTPGKTGITARTWTVVAAVVDIPDPVTVTITGATTYQYGFDYSNRGPFTRHEDVIEKQIWRGSRRHGPFPS